MSNLHVTTSTLLSRPPETTDLQILNQALLKVPFDQKWEIIRASIKYLYIEQDCKLSEVIKCMKERHNFNATYFSRTTCLTRDAQYKYQIRKWKLKKSVPDEKKQKLYKDPRLQTRAQAGKSSVVTYKGQIVDNANLRRFIKNQTRKEAREEMALQPAVAGRSGNVNSPVGHPHLFGNRIFMNWNMPYGPKRSTPARAADYSSPLSDFVVATPASVTSVPSPTAAAIRTRSAFDNARMFLQGRHIELLKTMEHQQRVTMSTWMYQFWLFSFKTAKHWGRGPSIWTAEILGFENYQQQNMVSISSANTPASNFDTPATVNTPMNETTDDDPDSRVEKKPSNLCKWSIHVRQDIQYKSVPSPPPLEYATVDLDHEQSWPRWPDSENLRTFAEKLSDGLESNDFSTFRHNDLPVAVNQIVKATKRSSAELDKEALGFSIMSRNVELITDLLERKDRVDTSDLYPFHLAVTYLDGAKSCCNVLDTLDRYFPVSSRKIYVNDLGHTILDQLMMNILKAHTSCLPVVVDYSLKKERRFQGEDVDICGRWDADSDCIRSLLADGNPAVPFEWKHMFCHTSVQTIIHCIGTIFGPSWRPDINTPSGLFIRRCSHCRLKLQLFPLHTLLLVGLHLAWSGCEDETLFGILACLVCLLKNGANPLFKADISLRALMGDGEADECDHIELDPLELVEKVPASLKLAWSESIQTGWLAICMTLKHAQEGWGLLDDGIYCAGYGNLEEHGEDETGLDMDTDNPLCEACSEDSYQEDQHVKFFGKRKVLAPLWAAIQTELLTYRRMEEGDPWISSNFSMESLNNSLSSGDDMRIAFVQENLMKPLCGCGNFLGRGVVPACPVAQDAASHHFMNFDHGNRTTYIRAPDDRIGLWYGR